MAPAIAPCTEKKRLTDAYFAAVRELNNLRDADARALVEGGGELDRIKMAMTAARTDIEKAKRAFIQHVRTHRC